MTNHLTALVPMKGNSERVPQKNIRPMAGKPLFYWILQTLHQVPAIDEIVVDTDSDKIEEGVLSFFPNVTIVRRPEHLHGDEVPMNKIIENVMDQVPSDIYLQTHSTNPLLTVETLQKAIADFEVEYQKEDGADSMFAVTTWKTRFFNPDGTAMNHDPNELIPTQDLDPIYEENSNFYLFTKDTFIKRGHRIGTKPILYPMDRLEAVDIDEMPDFEFAEFLVQKTLKNQAA